ncbi:uncharacterized protein LOC121976549 [Zingiber officinale]|uniref:uncharacterized protein LOC121976549 n=1 Tax=Zingiber officinale TaxID=94328 RepID=UPI001C4DAFE5|nr:uncharacterized protein LOC121976549 [Zingiber officinale]
MARRAEREKLPASESHHSTPIHCRRSSFSYRRLPEQRLRLSVLKLDGSSFDLEIAKAATVMELKMKIEIIFDKIAVEGGYSISWSHVWNRFCLCYNGYKLINDGEQLIGFGIKDGDQLHFAKHASPNQNQPERKSGSRVTDIAEHRMSSAWQHAEENDEHFHEEEQQGSIVVQKQFNLVDRIREWYGGWGSPRNAIVRHRKKISWAICY